MDVTAGVHPNLLIKVACSLLRCGSHLRTKSSSSLSTSRSASPGTLARQSLSTAAVRKAASATEYPQLAGDLVSPDAPDHLGVSDDH